MTEAQHNSVNDHLRARMVEWAPNLPNVPERQLEWISRPAEWMPTTQPLAALQVMEAARFNGHLIGIVASVVDASDVMDGHVTAWVDGVCETHARTFAEAVSVAIAKATGWKECE